jgi:hypothetical protein
MLAANEAGQASTRVRVAARHANHRPLSGQHSFTGACIESLGRIANRVWTGPIRRSAGSLRRPLRHVRPSSESYEACRERRRAGLQRVEAAPLSYFSRPKRRRGALLLGYAAFTPEVIHEGARRLARALEPLQRVKIDRSTAQCAAGCAANPHLGRMSFSPACSARLRPASPAGFPPASLPSAPAGCRWG